MFSFAAPRQHRRPSLTPMIDVVFLLLVFFMLAARFGQDTLLPLSTVSGQNVYEGPPRLVRIEAQGLTLNGAPLPLSGLSAALTPLMNDPSDTVILQPMPQAELQRLVDVLDHLSAAGFGAVTVVPAP